MGSSTPFRQIISFSVYPHFWNKCTGPPSPRWCFPRAKKEDCQRTDRSPPKRTWEVNSICLFYFCMWLILTGRGQRRWREGGGKEGEGEIAGERPCFPLYPEELSLLLIVTNDIPKNTVISNKKFTLFLLPLNSSIPPYPLSSETY